MYERISKLDTVMWQYMDLTLLFLSVRTRNRFYSSLSCHFYRVLCTVLKAITLSGKCISTHLAWDHCFNNLSHIYRAVLWDRRFKCFVSQFILISK